MARIPWASGSQVQKVPGASAPGRKRGRLGARRVIPGEEGSRHTEDVPAPEGPSQQLPWGLGGLSRAGAELGPNPSPSRPDGAGPGIGGARARAPGKRHWKDPQATWRALTSSWLETTYRVVRRGRKGRGRERPSLRGARAVSTQQQPTKKLPQHPARSGPGPAPGRAPAPPVAPGGPLAPPAGGLGQAGKAAAARVSPSSGHGPTDRTSASEPFRNVVSIYLAAGSTELLAP